MLRTLAASIAFLLATMTHAAIKTERIEYRHGDTVLEGTLAYDDAAPQGEKRPGILVCHEWWGNNAYAESRIKQLAGLGYIAFALDMYGKGRATTKPEEAESWMKEITADLARLRERAGLGLKVLAGHARVDPARLGVIGYCMGGFVAIELARSGLPHTEHLRAVVPFHSSTVSAKVPTDNTNIKGSVLVCHGAADNFVAPGELDTFEKQMAEAKVDYQLVSFGGAVHSFTNPAADGKFNPMVKHDPRADRRSWESMKSLFTEVFSR